MCIDVKIEPAKFSIMEWRNPKNDRPKENDRCLVIVGSDVHAARFIGGSYFLINWTRANVVDAWAEWPKAPIL